MFGLRGKLREPLKKEAGRFELRRSTPKPVPVIPKKQKKALRKTPAFQKLRTPQQGVSSSARRVMVPAAFAVDFTPRVLTVEPVDVGLSMNPNLHGIPIYRKRTA
jgi:hypothetical protein